MMATGLGPLRFQRPAFPSATAIESYFRLARQERWFSNEGPCLRLFRNRLSERTGVSCLPVASGTLGLVVAAAVLRDERGRNEALLPSFTFPATVQAVLWNGLVPVFVDVGADHWHMCPDALDEALAARGDRVGLVVACSAFGTPPPAPTRVRWEKACRKEGVRLLVDSAAGFGATAEDGVPIGSQGDTEVVSFHATKPLAVGEGGAVFSRDSDLIERMRRVANFGFDEQRRPGDPMAINAKLDELHAAVGLAALDEFDGALAHRRELALDLLKLVGPSFVPQYGHESGTYQFVPVLAPDGTTRDRILKKAANAVELRTYYEPLHLTPAFSPLLRAGQLSVTEELGRRMLSLPMAVDLTVYELETVAEALRQA